MLLRGCRLRNTRWCYGVVVFAGKDTKLMMNSGKSKFKRTNLDKFLNTLITGVCFFQSILSILKSFQIMMFLVAMCLICAVLSGVWEFVTGRYFTAYVPWQSFSFLGTDQDGLHHVAFRAFLMFFSYIILLNTVVPISLYIRLHLTSYGTFDNLQLFSVETLRFVHSAWINNDTKMYYEPTDTPACARTTTLNEELGQVQYIFSDKTGTLTQNIMLFRKCSINGKAYGDMVNDEGEPVDLREVQRCSTYTIQHLL